jgi:hypothetical protein
MSVDSVCVLICLPHAGGGNHSLPPPSNPPSPLLSPASSYRSDTGLKPRIGRVDTAMGSSPAVQITGGSTGTTKGGGTPARTVTRLTTAQRAADVARLLSEAPSVTAGSETGGSAGGGNTSVTAAAPTHTLTDDDGTPRSVRAGNTGNTTAGQLAARSPARAVTPPGNTSSVPLAASAGPTGGSLVSQPSNSSLPDPNMRPQRAPPAPPPAKGHPLE